MTTRPLRVSFIELEVKVGEHREKHTIFGPFPDADPLDTARLFLRTNRYEILLESTGPTPDSLQIDRGLVATDEQAPDDEADEPETSDAAEEEADEPDADEQGADEQDADEEEADEQRVDEQDADEEEADEQDADEEEAEHVEEEQDPAETPVPPPERLDEIVVRMTARRGERWAGLTSSNMADLETTVKLNVVENSIQVEYIVNTTGQFLNDDERKYWKREAAALEAFVTGGDLVSVVSDESSRSSRARRELLGWAMWVAAIVFVVVFIGGVVFVRFG